MERGEITLTPEKNVLRESAVTKAEKMVKKERRWVPRNTLSKIQKTALAVSLTLTIGISYLHPKTYEYLPMLLDNNQKTQVLQPERQEKITFSQPQGQKLADDWQGAKTQLGETSVKIEEKGIRQRLFEAILEAGAYPLEINLENQGKNLKIANISDFDKAGVESRGLISRESVDSYGDIRKNPNREKLLDIVEDKYLQEAKIWVVGDGLVIYDNQEKTYTSYFFPIPKTTEEQPQGLQLAFKDLKGEEVEYYTKLSKRVDTRDKAFFVGALKKQGFNEEKRLQLKNFFEELGGKSKYDKADVDTRVNSAVYSTLDMVLLSGLNPDTILDLYDYSQKIGDKDISNIYPFLVMNDRIITLYNLFNATGETTSEGVKKLIDEIADLQKEMPLFMETKPKVWDFLSLVIQRHEEIGHYKEVYGALPDKLKGNTIRLVYYMKNIGYSYEEILKIAEGFKDLTYSEDHFAYKISDFISRLNENRTAEERLTPTEIIAIQGKIVFDLEKLNSGILKPDITNEGFVLKFRNIANYYLTQEKAGRNWREIKFSELEQVFGLGYELSEILTAILDDYNINLEGISSKEEIIKEIAGHYGNKIYEDKDKDRQIDDNYSLVYFINHLHDWETAKYGTDNLRNIFADSLTHKSIIEIIKSGSMRLYNEGNLNFDNIYTSTFVVLYNRLQSFPKEEHESLLKAQGLDLGNYALALGRYGMLETDVKAYPEIYLPVIKDLLTEKLHHNYYFLLSDGLKAGLESNLSSSYQTLIYEFYQEQNGERNEASAFAAYTVMNNQKVMENGAYGDFFRGEAPTWPKIEKPVMPDFSKDKEITAIFYYNKSDEIKETKGMPGSLEYFSRIGYTQTRIDDDNWIISGNKNGKKIAILVTFERQDKAIEKFREVIGQEKPSVSGFLQHSPRVDDFYSMPPPFDDSGTILFLGSCGSNGRVPLLQGNEYSAQLVTNMRVGFPEVNNVLLGNLLAYVAGGGRDWEAFSSEIQTLITTYNLSTPLDPDQQLLKYYIDFKGTK